MNTFESRLGTLIDDSLRGGETDFATHGEIVEALIRHLRRLRVVAEEPKSSAFALYRAMRKDVT